MLHFDIDGLLLLTMAQIFRLTMKILGLLISENSTMPELPMPSPCRASSIVPEMARPALNLALDCSNQQCGIQL